MVNPPAISFHLPNRPEPLSPRDRRWQTSLPNRPGPGASDRNDPLPCNLDIHELSYGEYFNTVSRFIAKNNFSRLGQAVERLAPASGDLTRWKIKIVSEKHGAFYHPARIEVDTGRCVLNFVVNLALSPQGLEALPLEVENLLRLELEFGLPFLPRIFDSGEERMDPNRRVSLFLGEWFDHHHEFHLARNPYTGEDGIHLWDPSFPGCFLDSEEVGQLFRQSAYILTCYYNPVTTEHIYPWHHAAGDFLWGGMGSDTGGSVKLITVRGYQPLLGRVSHDPAAGDIVDGLVIFFLNLALRMRMDRRDGVDRIGWHGPGVLGPVLDGFLDGLEYQAARYGFPQDFSRGFKAYFMRLKMSDYQVIYHDIVEQFYPGNGEEFVEVERGLEKHMGDLKAVVACR
jgi:hypothetical protein